MAKDSITINNFVEAARDLPGSGTRGRRIDGGWKLTQVFTWQTVKVFTPTNGGDSATLEVSRRPALHWRVRVDGLVMAGTGMATGRLCYRMCEAIAAGQLVRPSAA